MTDHLDPRDELASAYLDGDVTPAEAARVEADRDLLARVEAMRAAAALLGDAPDPCDPARRDRAIEAALAAAETPMAVTDLAAARARRTRMTRAVGIAAALLLLVAAVPLLARSGDGNDDADTAAEAPGPEELRSETMAGGDADTGAAVADEAAPEAGATTTFARRAFDDLESLARTFAMDDGAGGAEPPGPLPGEQCPAVAGGPIVTGALVVLEGREVTAFVLAEDDGRRLVVLDATTCAVIAERGL